MAMVALKNRMPAFLLQGVVVVNDNDFPKLSADEAVICLIATRVANGGPLQSVKDLILLAGMSVDAAASGYVTRNEQWMTQVVPMVWTLLNEGAAKDTSHYAFLTALVASLCETVNTYVTGGVESNFDETRFSHCETMLTMSLDKSALRHVCVDEWESFETAFDIVHFMADALDEIIV